jgi:hypothetical protein
MGAERLLWSFSLKLKQNYPQLASPLKVVALSPSQPGGHRFLNGFAPENRRFVLLPL